MWREARDDKAIPIAMTEAEVLFTELLGCDRALLYLDKERRLSREQSRSVADALKRRTAGEPLEYILGKCEFMGLEFFVDQNVLIPRPETELLVETAVRYARGMEKPLIADIGTGSGNIAVSCAFFLPSCRVVAVDSSPGALALARRNAERHGCSQRICFGQADLMEGTVLWPDSCRLILANPPYVVSGEIDTLAPEVRCQPRPALDGGIDGLAFYRRLAAQAPLFLCPGGLLILEIGAGQSEAVSRIIEAGRILSVREVIRDYNSIARVIVAKKG